MNALLADHVDFILPIAEIGPKLVRLVTQSLDSDDVDCLAPQEAAR